MLWMRGIIQRKFKMSAAFIIASYVAVAAMSFVLGYFVAAVFRPLDDQAMEYQLEVLHKQLLHGNETGNHSKSEGNQP